jgi:hypothetical protein
VELSYKNKGSDALIRKRPGAFLEAATDSHSLPRCVWLMWGMHGKNASNARSGGTFAQPGRVYIRQGNAVLLRQHGSLGPWGQPQGIVRVVGGGRRTAALPSAELLQPHMHVLDRTRQVMSKNCNDKGVGFNWERGDFRRGHTTTKRDVHRAELARYREGGQCTLM